MEDKALKAFEGMESKLAGCETELARMKGCKMDAYEVTVVPRYPIGDSFAIRTEKGVHENLPCRHSKVIVVTDDPSTIYKKFGTVVVEEIKKLGPGMVL